MTFNLLRLFALSFLFVVSMVGEHHVEPVEMLHVASHRVRACVSR